MSFSADHYDVKMPCHLILSKLAEKCGSAVLAGSGGCDGYWFISIQILQFNDTFTLLLSVLDTLVEPLEKTVTNKTKQDAVKQEVDRNEDMIRSALRAIDSLNRIRYFCA